MITISLCMIVKDEEETLARCLESVAGIADEIIIIDTGSTDRTKEVASCFTDKIYNFVWIDDFSAARNFSFSQATQDYILWLDADDLLLPEDREKLLRLKETLPPQIDAVMMKYHTGFDEQGRVTFSCFRERLVKRSRNFIWSEPVHEALLIGGPTMDSDICVTHTKKYTTPSRRNLEIYEALLKKGCILTTRGQYYYARELKDHGCYADAIAAFLAFLSSGKGWVEDNIAACGALAECYLASGQAKKALCALLCSLHYDKPRPEICCQMGYLFKEMSLYQEALSCFEQALVAGESPSGHGFVQEDCRGYIPCLECAVCLDRLGQREAAAAYNERAGAFKPDSPAVLRNREYFMKA